MPEAKKNKDFEKQLIKKAWKDSEFKKALKKDPKAAIQKELQVVLPEGVEIKVVEETDKKFYLVIPQDPSKAKKSDSKGAGEVEAMTYT